MLLSALLSQWFSWFIVVVLYLHLLHVNKRKGEVPETGESQRTGLNTVTELRDRRLWQAGTKKSRLVETKKKRMLVKEEAGYRNFLHQRKGRS